MVIVIALLVLFSAVAAVFGWLLAVPALFQLTPTIAPMQFNSALGLALSALALLLYEKQYHRTALAMCSVPVVIGLLTLLEYIFQTNLRIDELFISSEIMVGTSHPGRMGPNSALSFIVLGLAIVGLNHCKHHVASQFIALALVLTLLALSIEPLIGYLLGVEAAYGWGQFTQIAPQTSFSFLLLSLALAYQGTAQYEGRKYLFFTLFLFFSVFALDMIMPLGVAVGVSYVPLVLSCLWFKQKSAPWLSAILASILIILGYFVSPPPISTLEYALINRMLSIIAVWVIAASVFLFLKKERESVEIKEHLEMALEGAALSPWKWDLVSDEITFSNTLITMLGYNVHSFPSKEAEWYNLIHPGDRDATKAVITDCLTGDKSTFELEFRVQHKQGQWLTLRSLGKVSKRSVIGQPLQVSGIHENITERIQKDEQLRLLEAAINNSKDALLITNANIEDPSIVFASASNIALSGYQPEELLGKNPNILQDRQCSMGEQLEQRQRIKEALANNKVFTGEMINVTKDGREYWVRLTIFPVQNTDGVTTHFGSLGSDISAERQVQQLLKLEQEQFQTAMESSPIGIALVSLEGEWIRVNRAMCELLEYPEAELITRNFKELTHPDDIELDLPYIEPMFNGEINSYEIEKRYKAKSGRIFWALLTVSLIRDKNNNPMHFISQVQDINERKVQEAQVSQYLEALEISNQELDDFAYIASHDLKEPLRGINNHAHSLLKLYHDKFDERGQRKLNRMAVLAEKMEQLISDLLYFSRIGRAEDAKETFSVEELINSEVQLLGKLISESNGRVEISAPLPELYANRFKVSIIFRNLISNALKYNDNEQKLINIRFDKHFKHDTKTLNNVFHVQDNGIGIDPMFHDNIFRMFKRLNSEKSYGSGTGAGLAFVAKIIKQVGGQIWVDSELGKGSTFHFTLEGVTHEPN
ncbi:PAS domain S-box protein [Reinekea marina]|uniref:histidine kinase n=1 Tax=Reinekea marina TaxID=1310421 RepID=A0ABV7WRK1_9GAMM|nr:PAS domain S-box protein [Reinekea marina]MDN3651017.1 PAS domain S-box protein [Reinekea marina]